MPHASTPRRSRALETLPRLLALALVLAPAAEAGDEAVLGVTGELRDRLERLLHEHDAAVVSGDRERLNAMYARGFRCEDLDVHGAETMIDRWCALHDHFRQIRLDTQVLHVDRLGSAASVHCARPFFAVDREDGTRARDAFDMTFLVQLDGEQPGAIFAAFLRDDAPARVLRPRPRLSAPLLDLALDFPRWMLPVPCTPEGAALMELLLLDPARQLRLRVIVHQSSYPTCLLRALSCDAPVAQQEERLHWRSEPHMVERPGPFQAAACEFELSEGAAGLAPAPSWLHRMMYLSEDHEVLIQLVADGPAGQRRRLVEAIETVASSLRWSSEHAEDDDRRHAERLLDLNPHWRTVEDGIFRHPWAPLSMIVPDGLVATPLAGDRQIRVRLVLEEDPETAMCLSVFECGDHSPCPETEARNIVRAMKCVMCRPGAQPRIKVVEPMELLDTEAVCVTLPMECAAGVVREHRAMALSRPPYHVQLQLVPGSDLAEVQEECFLQTLTALEWD